MRIGCQTLQWGMAIDTNTRYTWDGRIWKRSFADILSDIAKLGFEGFDCSENDIDLYGSNIEDFRRIVSDLGLKFVSAWVTLLPKRLEKGVRPTINPKLPMSDPKQFLPICIRNIRAQAVKEDFNEKVKYTKSMSALGSNLITLGGPFIRRQDIRDTYYRMIAELLDKLGEEAKKFDMKIAYHNHLCTLVQSTEDIEKLFDYADKNLLKLCLDTAHLSAAGDDPIEFVKKYSYRIAHVHLKDLLKGRFVELGKGELRLRSIIESLRKYGYRGWLIAELDVPSETAYGSALMSKKFLDNVLRVQTK